MIRKIGGPFGRSPFGPLHEHMAKARACVALLPPMVESFGAGDGETAARLAGDVHRVEHEADLIKTDIRNRLSSNVFSAAQRADIIGLLRAQDNVADFTEAVAGMMELRHTPVPEPLRPQLVELANDLKAACDELVDIEAQLDAGEEPPSMDSGAWDARQELDRFYALIHQSTVTARSALGRVFEFESSLDSVSVIFLMTVISQMESVGDELENTADMLMRMLSA